MSSISIKMLEDVLSNSRDFTQDVNIKDFMSLHKTTESYFRRLLYISLRLNEFNDNLAKKITKECALNSNEILKKSIGLIGGKKKNQQGENLNYNSIENKYPRLKKLISYYISHTSRVRNQYLHGIKDSISPETVRLAYIVESKLLCEIESILKAEYNQTCTDTPTEWGVKRTKKNDETIDIDRRMKELKLGEKGKSPIKNNSLKRGLIQIFSEDEVKILKKK